MEIVRNEQTPATRMQVDNYWEKKTYNQIYPRKPHGKGFTNAQLKLNILINAMMHDEEKYDLGMSKTAGIIFKLISDQHQSIIKR